MKPDEAAFEAEICDWLTSRGGYDCSKVGNAAGRQGDFDAALGLDTAELMTFVGATQGERWDTLVKRHGGDQPLAQQKFKKRLAAELDKRGTVDVLRHGIVDNGVTFDLAYRKPAHTHTPELQARYEANRVTVTRQLPYSAGETKTVDLALFVNGVPVATAELKNALTGQTIGDAKRQYLHDRDPADVTLGRRAVVHFAVDTDTVEMTTRLAGAATRFLPFNRGCGTGGGNPPNPDGQRTAYLWQQIWQRDAWLDLLARFVHVVAPPKGAPRGARADVIFPRYHQWDAVVALEAAARAEGSGHDYLVQHSAGSGKSNTIAWLAYRLSTLHDDADAKIFDKVVVITDRKVLDRQLQDTIHQFEHQPGVVVKIDKDSAQLAEALAGHEARIVVTTLQKFPVVLERGVDLPDRTYAVIIDEAHSSQTGEAHKDLKLVLGAGDDEAQLAMAELEDPAAAAAEAPDRVADALEAHAKARGRPPNMSSFAFTATPKARTLERFGRLDRVSGHHEPFHLYSMRQAIEEGFILDTLANYVTYETYWSIEKQVHEDPRYDPKKAKAAIARFVSLHDHNLAQKAEIVVEHYRRHVAHRVGGQAKAMVVTSSRAHAVRYCQALRKYVAERGYGIGILVAFSGMVVDGGVDHTESSLNAFPESQTPSRFDTPEWNVLVVAEKYQTGFDQPLLCAMYVDKVLTGLNAVQTLSRLNRIHPLKKQEDVFVLDFRNEADDIQAAFAPWYARTVAPPTDPNLLYDTFADLENMGVIRPGEVERVVALLLAPATTGDHGALNAALDPAKDCYDALDPDDQDTFRDRLGRFVHVYGFLSQVVAFGDAKLEANYLYAKALAAKLREDSGTALDLGQQVELTHLRVEERTRGSITLGPDEGEVTTIFSGTGKRFEEDEEPLSAIIERVNARFGTDWAPADRAFPDAIAAKLVAREDIQQAAAANTIENFALVLAKAFEAAVVNQLTVNEDMAVKLLDDADLRDMILAAYTPDIYARARRAHAETESPTEEQR